MGKRARNSPTLSEPSEEAQLVAATEEDSPIRIVVTFAAGGTLHESVSGGGFAPGQRSDGHGTWTHNGGQTYDQRFVSMIAFTTAPGPGPGFEAGWMQVHHTVEMIDADHIQSAGTNSFYRLSGEVYRTGCSTATGRRFE